MRLTPEIIEASYNFLATTQPFKGWSLPSSDDIGWHITRRPNVMGICDITPERKFIGVSDQLVANTSTLLNVVAHELVHLRRYLLRQKHWYDHGPEFRRLWRQVARHHGFDPKAL